LIIGAPEITPQNWAYFQKLQALTQALNLEDKVIFTGFRDDVPRLIAALDVVVLSSSTPEPFGRVVIEGMAAGKPVVATAAGGVLDIIRDGVDGLLVPCKDVKAMAEAIYWLLSNREQTEQMGLLARRRVEEKFTVQHHVAAVGRVYDTIMEKELASLEVMNKP
jgi:glycosyltransferase involved in cell wall biosynthesis